MGLIDILSSIAKFLPDVKVAEKPPSGKERFIWTGIALLLFFLMYHITVFGISISASAGTDFLQTITASRLGSLITTGIGPIVLASIFLQLFVGAGIIKLNMHDKKDKKKFHEAQKVLAIILALVEATIYATTALSGYVVPGLPQPLTTILIVVQIALGSVIMIYLDEIVTKYGIGSGISLFIAAGVSQAIIGGLFGLIFNENTGMVAILTSGGAESIARALLVLLPLIATVIVFMVCVFAEGVKVEIPIAFERVRGMAPKLPLKFFYVSNIPVIFAAALILNIQIFAGAALPKHMDADGNVNIAAVQDDFISKYIGFVNPEGRLSDGFLYFITPVNAGGTDVVNFWQNYLLAAETPINKIPEWVHAVTYILFLAFISVLFGIFWTETSNMDAKSVTNQLMQSGIQIPGFRRDPRMIEQILGKYIFPLTVLGSFSVGLLAGLADLTGALGTGTGILLTVGILYRMYEQIEQMNMFEMYPGLGNLIGKD
ncbi:MAG: preprotein translocase subunit SecY [Candidatus Micrarchaeota archaeon]